MYAVVGVSAEVARVEQFQHADGGRRRTDAQLPRQTQQDQLVHSARDAEGQSIRQTAPPPRYRA